MSAQQAELVAFKAEVAASAANVAASIKRLEDVVTQSNADAAAAAAVISELQHSYSTISLQAAPCSAATQAEVAASEAKATGALSEVRALYEATKTEVEELRRRASEVEKRSGGDKRTKWEMSRPKDMEPSPFGSKEDQWPKFREDLMDFADAVHPGLKGQLEYTLRQKEEVTSFSMRSNPLGSTEEDWELRREVYKLLKRKTEATTDARKIVECVEHSNGFEVWRLLGVRYDPQAGMKRLAELGELMSLRDKRCKNTQETALIVLELYRRTKIIAMAGGKPPDEDVAINILWMSMDPSTKVHVTGKVDMDSVNYVELR